MIDCRGESTYLCTNPDASIVSGPYQYTRDTKDNILDEGEKENDTLLTNTKRASTSQIHIRYTCHL